MSDNVQGPLIATQSLLKVLSVDASTHLDPRSKKLNSLFLFVHEFLLNITLFCDILFLNICVHP